MSQMILSNAIDLHYGGEKNFKKSHQLEFNSQLKSSFSARRKKLWG